MATRVDTDQVPTQDTIEKLLRYLDILYPNGEPINPRQGDDDGYPVYKGEVDDFYRLVEEDWFNPQDSMKKGYELCTHRDLIQSASWSDVKATFTFCLRKERFFSGEQGRAISVGIIKLLLLRVKELAHK